MRAFLENVTKRQIPVTYQEPAKALQISPPHSHSLGRTLDRLTGENGDADRPFITAFIISNAQCRPAGAWVLRLRPTSRAGSYDPLLLSKSTRSRRGGAGASSRGRECRRHLIPADPPAY